MTNEGFLGRTKISGEKAATDDHPVIIHALPLVDGLTGILAPGLILERAETGKYQPCDGSAPRAVVNEPCDTETETSAKCIVHGCVKTRLLKKGDVEPEAEDLDALMDSGIFAV